MAVPEVVSKDTDTLIIGPGGVYIEPRAEFNVTIIELIEHAAEDGEPEILWAPAPLFVDLLYFSLISIKLRVTITLASSRIHLLSSSFSLLLHFSPNF